MRFVYFTLIAVMIMELPAAAQSLGKIPDSTRKKYQTQQKSQLPQKKESPQKNQALQIEQPIQKEQTKRTIEVSTIPLDQDSLIKVKLVELAQENNSSAQSDANIRIAEANLQQAKSAWLSSITAGANINEFVVNSSPLSNFFPKYNLGIAIPFDIVARSKRERKVAEQMLIISQSNKKERNQLVRTEVLIRYETYKQKKELVVVQKNSLEYDYSAYLSAQQAYADGDVKIEAMDRAYQNYLDEKEKLMSRELEARIAVLELEQLIGMPLDNAIALALKKR